MFPIYANIKKYRKSKGLSQTELAKLVGYADKTMISHIENGKIDLSQSKVEEFAKVLGVDPGTLMGWTQQETEYTLVKETFPLFENRPDIEELVDVAKESTPENVKVATTMLKGLKNNIIEKVPNHTKVSKELFEPDFIKVDGKANILIDRNAKPGPKKAYVKIKKSNDNVG